MATLTPLFSGSVTAEGTSRNKNKIYCIERKYSSQKKPESSLNFYFVVKVLVPFSKSFCYTDYSEVNYERK